MSSKSSLGEKGNPSRERPQPLGLPGSLSILGSVAPASLSSLQSRGAQAVTGHDLCGKQGQCKILRSVQAPGEGDISQEVQGQAVRGKGTWMPGRVSTGFKGLEAGLSRVPAMPAQAVSPHL